jgi:hypothetical protein
MPKVSVTISIGQKKRTYTGDYAFVGLLNEDGSGSRWEQEPTGWKDGLGIFFTGMHALKTVAEQEGNEGFKIAARTAMDVLSLFDPEVEAEEKKSTAERLLPFLEKRAKKKSKTSKKEETEETDA